MGQARNRGTFEQRRWAAIETRQKEKEARKLEKLKREIELTPTQRLKRHNDRVLLSIALANIHTLLK